MPARRLVPSDLAAEWQARREAGESCQEIASSCGFSASSVVGHTVKPGASPSRPRPPALHPINLPEPAAEFGGPSFPEPWEQTPVTPFDMQADGPGIVTGDWHLPAQDKKTIEVLMQEAVDRRVKWFLINGDYMDMAGVSPFFREYSKRRFADELEMGKAGLQYVRSRLPNARIVYKQGNHEFRLTRFLRDKAEELEDLDCLQLESLLGLKDFGIEWVQDKRTVMVGKLPVLHGHEFRQGISPTVSPARTALLKAGTSVMVSHHHRTSFQPQRTIKGDQHGAWSIGCACFLSPQFDPHNQWNLGWAMVDVSGDGGYQVNNRMLLKNGTVA